MKKTDKKQPRRPQDAADKALLPVSPKRKIRKRSLALVAIVLFLLVAVLIVSHRPAVFAPPTAEAKQLSPYLTHELLPVFYNNVQKPGQFELEVTQDGLNEIITHLGWPKKFEELTINTPQALFTDKNITLMAPLISSAAEVLLTVSVCPSIDDGGLMNLMIERVQIGAMSITPLAKIISNKMYRDRIEKEPPDPNNISTNIAASLFADAAFDPVFKFEKYRFRIRKIDIEPNKTILKIEPLANN